MDDFEAAYAAKPWLTVRPAGGPEVMAQSYDHVLAAFHAAVVATPTAPAIIYFDAVIDYARLDALSDAFALWLTDHGVGHGARVMIILQNTPHFTVAAVGAWKAGAIPTPSNPMYKQPELRKLFADCAPAAVVCHPEHRATIEAALADAGLRPPILVAAARDFQVRDDARVLPPAAPAPAGADDFLAALAPYAGRKPPPVRIRRDDMALLLYTSGTTGLPKGAMISHGSLAFVAQLAAGWFRLRPAARMLTVAPLFHITGFAVNLSAAFVVGGSTVLTYRFEPDMILDAMLEHRPHMLVGAITVYTALMNRPQAAPAHFESFDALISGGAPIPPAVVEAFAAKLGASIYPSYGMTETCAPTHISPVGSHPPADPGTGAMSIGVPVSNTAAKIVDEAGHAVPVGEAGELWVRGPQIMAGYWNKPAETAEALAGGWMHTGDVGFMDARGWFYLVDRKKDMISASGFKVWPREVEDVIYTHPAIREVAVVGVPDDYRGETVKAVVSLKPGHEASGQELIDFCRERLAAYKAPRRVEVVDELPKTASGKIMRSAVRGG